MITSSISSIIHDDVFLKMQGLGPEFHLKLEAFNPAGSIKLKTAQGLVKDAASRHRLDRDSILIESSSGNLGVALATICAERGLKFICVVDPNSSRQNVAAIRSLGAEVVCIETKDENGGYLGSRIAYIKEQVAKDPRHIWLNQYENFANPLMHASSTASAIARQFEHVDYLFIGAGTTGTLMGCLRYFSRHRPRTRIVAVDSVGSITFGFPSSPRHIPGLGVSMMPAIFDPDGLYAVEMVPESQAVAMCRYLARHRGLLAGGSTGTVLAGLYAWRDRIPPGATVVALSPDWGDRYLDTVYDDRWVESRFGPETLLADLDSIGRNPGKTVVMTSPDRDTSAFHVVDGRAVAEILDGSMVACIDDVERAYLDHEAGLTINPDSSFLRFPERSHDRIIALPAHLSGHDGCSGIKWISSFPRNVENGLQRASAVLLLNDPTTGYAYACLEASRISAARTAASAVLAARWLSPHVRSVDRIAFVGGGIIARTILQMFAQDGWCFRSALIHDLAAASAEDFARGARDRDGVCVEQGSLDDALDADIVVLATTASEPYIEDADFRPGQLILNISLRDIAPRIIERSNNILDDVEHCLKANTSPDLAVRRYGHRRFINGTLAQYINGAIALDPARAVIFSPFGLGVLDLAVGRRLYAEARARGRARPMPDFHFDMAR